MFVGCELIVAQNELISECSQVVQGQGVEFVSIPINVCMQHLLNVL